jgi:hypothetical protein
MKKICRLFVFVLTLFLTHVELKAQFAIFTGYDYMHLKPKAFNSIITQYRQLNPSDYRQLSFLTNIQGVTFGAQYSIPFLRFESSWTTRFAFLKEEITRNGRNYRHELYYKNNSISLGGEFFYSWVGVGASLDYNFLRIQDEPVYRRSVNILKKDAFSYQLYLNFEVSFDDFGSFAIRPYVNIPRYTVNYYPVYKTLINNTLDIADPSIYDAQPMGIGLRLLLINGKRFYDTDEW